MGDKNTMLDNGEPAEVERYELREGPRYRFDANRREFVQALGAGLVVAVGAERGVAQRPRRGGGRRGSRAATIAQRFHIGKDGVITVLTSKVEVGQGSRTQIAQAAAEELRLPLTQINVVMADTARCPDDGGTAGSRTTPATVPAVRQASALLRELLLDMAAARLEVDRGSLRIAEDKFLHGEKSVTIADLAADEELSKKLDAARAAEVSIAPVEKWSVLGTSVPRVDAALIVTGEHKYPSDVVRPGMLYGKVLRPPKLGARLESVDAAAARRLDGVAVVHDGDFAGCAAENSWLAEKALAAMAAGSKWETPETLPSSDEIFEHFKRRPAEEGRSRARENEWGDREAALAAAKTKIDVAYTVAYIQHAPMEPRAAVAEWGDGKLTVWTGTQQPSRVRGELADAFNMREDRVRVIVPDTGGGFGGKHSGEHTVEAARLAKAAGRPVSLRWTREEEFTWAYFRPAGLIEVRAGLDGDGKLSAWDFTNYNSGGSALDSPYRAAAGRTRFVACDSPLRQGSYRALASTANTFARESAIDELAAAVGADPLEFRLAHLPGGRLKDVLVAAAKKFGWERRRRETSAPRGIGIACGTEKGSFVAACAEVEIADGRLNVLSICQAYECGAIQNPANLRGQVVGCIIMGLGGALFEEVRFKDNQIDTASFADYRVPRLGDVPPIDVELVNRRDLPSVGAGETPIIAVAPAIANAIANAKAGRIRSMPLKLAAAAKG